MPATESSLPALGSSSLADSTPLLNRFQRYHLTSGSGLPSAWHLRLRVEPSARLMVPAGTELLSSIVGGTGIRENGIS